MYVMDSPRKCNRAAVAWFIGELRTNWGILEGLAVSKSILCERLYLSQGSALPWPGNFRSKIKTYLNILRSSDVYVTFPYDISGALARGTRNGGRLAAYGSPCITLLYCLILR